MGHWSLTASRSGRRIWSMSLSEQALVTTFAGHRALQPVAGRDLAARFRNGRIETTRSSDCRFRQWDLFALPQSRLERVPESILRGGCDRRPHFMHRVARQRGRAPTVRNLWCRKDRTSRALAGLLVTSLENSSPSSTPFVPMDNLLTPQKYALTQLDSLLLVKRLLRKWPAR